MEIFHQHERAIREKLVESFLRFLQIDPSLCTQHTRIKSNLSGPSKYVFYTVEDHSEDPPRSIQNVRKKLHNIATIHAGYSFLNLNGFGKLTGIDSINFPPQFLVDHL